MKAMLRKVTVVPNLALWEAPLLRWFEVLDEFRRVNDNKDEAFWYNERATLSTLAGALWRSGWMVLEEYSTAREGQGSESGAGRTDLWCRLGADEFTVEAKQDFKCAYPSKPETLQSRAELQLSWACVQCATDKWGAKSRLALVFMVPSLRLDPTEDSLGRWIDAVEAFRADLKVHYFNIPAMKSSKTGRFYPGVVLLGRLAPGVEDED